MKNLSIVVWFFALMITTSACNKKKDSESGAEATGSAALPAVGSGTITMQLTPKDEAPLESIQNANVTAQDHPEIVTTSDSSGVVQVEGVQPGTINLFVTSSPSTALADGPATYGLKVDAVVVKSGEITDLGTQMLKQTGSVHGTISFYTNPNNLELVGSDVYVPGTSFAAKTDATGGFSLAGLPEGLYDFRVEHTGFSALDLKGIQITESQVTELGTVPLSLSTGPEGAISVIPDKTAIVGDKTIKIATTSTVKFNLSYDGDAALMKVSDEPSFLNQEWKPVTTEGSWIFEDEDKQAVDGKKAIYVMYSDLNGLESSPYSAEVYVDTKVPVVNDVRLLHGWGSVVAKSDRATITMDVDATDEGAGVATLTWSTNEAFTNATTVTFSPEISGVLLTGGIGNKTVYVKVKDYAGRESTAAFDQIALATETAIAKRAYTKPLHLTTDLSPYSVADEVEIATDVTVDAGVTISLAYPGKLDLRGKFSAVGTNSNRITIKSATAPTTNNCSSASHPHLQFNHALPGVSTASVMKYVTFKYLVIDANGGSITDSVFDSAVCDNANGGELNKSGLDPLIIKDNTFNNWGNALVVKEGRKLTTFADNSGTSAIFYKQTGSTADTIIANNAFTGIGPSMYTPIVIENANAVDFGNSQIASQSNNHMISIHSSIELASISHLIGSTCNAIVEIYAKANVAISDSSFEDCATAMYPGGDLRSSSITFDHTDLALTYAIFPSNGTSLPDVTIKNSSFECMTSTGKICNFLHFDLPSQLVDITMTAKIQDSNVTCSAIGDGKRGCGGFTIDTTDLGAETTGTLTIQLDGNHYTAKPAESPITVVGLDGTSDININFANYQDATKLALVLVDRSTCGASIDPCINSTHDITVTGSDPGNIAGAHPRD